MVTWHDLGFGALALIAFLALGFGALMAFAGGMSSAPAEGAKTSRQGCIVAVVALVVFVGSCAKVLS